MKRNPLKLSHSIQIEGEFMLKILLTTIQTWFKKYTDQDASGLPNILKTPIMLPKKRWPDFLFREHNQNVDTRQTIVSHFDYPAYLNAYNTVHLFQTNNSNVIKTSDMLSALATQEIEIRKLLEVVDGYLRRQPSKKMESILSPINDYVNELIYLLAKQRNQLDGFVENAVALRLRAVSTSLKNLLKNLTNESTQSIVNKLQHMKNTLLLLNYEIKHLIQYQATYSRLSGVIAILMDMVTDPSHISAVDLKQATELCYHETGESKTFLSYSFCTLLARLAAPLTTTTEPTERLALKLHTNDTGPGTLSNPFVGKPSALIISPKEIPFASPINLKASKNSGNSNTSFFNRFLFWLPGNKDKKSNEGAGGNDSIKNSDLRVNPQSNPIQLKSV